jgi:hypothetical protein
MEAIKFFLWAKLKNVLVWRREINAEMDHN